MTEPAATTAHLDEHPPHHGAEGGVKETIESIIVAFILAFIFRGFVVEAFVIPTGSMAPTLLGAHMRFYCPDCGYRFDVNYQNDSGDQDDVSVPPFAVTPQGQNRVYAIYCPNCGYKLPRIDERDPSNDATAPPVRYGDRILVLKYSYLLKEPDRWDVVVFKSPTQPEHYDYGQNYIKRLVGRPGEAVMLLDGDVYVAQHGAALEEFKVQPKPRIVQEALWRIVHDNDYLPRGLERTSDRPWQQPWTAEQRDDGGWKLEGRAFRFDNADGAGTIYFNPSANPQTKALTDWLAYDSTAAGQNAPADLYLRPTYEPAANVSDVKLQFSYERQSGDGPLRVQITKFDDVFTAEITRQAATLFMRRGAGSGVGEPVAPPVPIRPKRGVPMQVELTNADYRVTLRIDGNDIVSTTPDQYHPDLEQLMQLNRGRRAPKPEIRITAERQMARLSHISLWRDVYYLNRPWPEQERGSNVYWGSPEQFPRYIMTLGPDEYFVLGDNSFISGDARAWTEPTYLPAESLEAPAGVVPGRFLLGKAFFVYWPAGYRPIEKAPALVPNFGDMRFIH